MNQCVGPGRLKSKVTLGSWKASQEHPCFKVKYADLFRPLLRALIAGYHRYQEILPVNDARKQHPYDVQQCENER